MYVDAILNKVEDDALSSSSSSTFSISPENLRGHDIESTSIRVNKYYFEYYF